MKHIIIVDDDRNIRQLVRFLLEREGFAVSEAENGKDGLKMLTARRPDLVIIDIFMPDQDGIETIMKLKDQAPGCPILAISGGGQLGGMEYLSYAKNFGANATLAKPFTRDELLRSITALIEPPQ